MEWRDLPSELIAEIVGLAILPAWPLQDFIPPAPSRDGLEGFALANKRCYGLYESFIKDAVFLTAELSLDEQIDKLSHLTKYEIYSLITQLSMST